MRSLISAFVIRCLDSTIPIHAKSKISRLYLASEPEQAGLRLTWSHTPKTGFLVTGLILYSTGDKWKIRRKLLTPTFHFKILHDFVHVFNEQTRILLEKLNQHADGKPYNIFNDITLCALDIICGKR